ncbi:hypothetical protein FKM82_000214 [Ascaphus truei]
MITQTSSLPYSFSWHIPSCQSRYDVSQRALCSWSSHICTGSCSLSSNTLISMEKLSFTAAMSSSDVGWRSQRFPRASGSSSKYFLIWEKRKHIHA